MTAEPSSWAPCSNRSRARLDPLEGTASHGDAWFLVESPGGWGRHAFLDPPYDTALGRRLVHRIERSGIRALAIRRPGRRPPRASIRWAFVDSRPGHESVRWGAVDDPHELLDVPLDGSTGRESETPVFAVCTHARHDQCCAVRGRPVASRLAERFPEETWECSHVGGDRFAGTMVLLPHGLYYGRVDDGDALEVADAYLRGEVVPAFLRGRSSLSPAVQAAQHAARAEFGDRRIEAYAPVHEERRDDTWYVTLRTGPTVVEVTLAAVLSEPLLSTCGATRAVAVPHLEVVDVRHRDDVAPDAPRSPLGHRSLD